MRTERYFKDIEVDDERAGLDLKELFCSLNPVESDGPLIAVANASVAIIVG